MKPLLALSFALVFAARSLAVPATTRATTQPTLHVGDVAPALAPARWLKGEPVTRFEPGTIYVVEFWATWCGPCVESIPDLTWHQAKRPNVVFIGVDVKEDDATLVAPFVARMGDRMKYRVAADASPGDYKPGPMWDAWMAAAGEGGIPCSFVIGGDGRIAAITHPGGLRPILDALQAGRPAPPPFADAEIADLTARWATYREATDRKDYAAAGVTLDGIEAVLAAHGIRAPKGYDATRQWLRISSGDFDAAQAAFDALDARVAADDVEPSTRNLADRQRLGLFAAQHDAAALNRFAAIVASRVDGDAEALNSLAWDLIGDPVGTGDHLPGVDLDLALHIATRADVASGHADANVLDTLARVCALRGDFARAVEVEAKASALTKNDRARASFDATLADYRAIRVK